MLEYTLEQKPQQIVDFDLDQFEADVWYYSGLEGVIKSDTWEHIVAHCVNGVVIPGDHFMADVHNDKYSFNVKSIKEQSISKTGNKTVEFVQCRTPIYNDRLLSSEDLGKKILETLDSKLKESLETFNSEKMIDVIILHNRYKNMYHASVYMVDHLDFNSYNFIWENGEGRLEHNAPWLLKRRWGDDNHRQTCTSIKRKYKKEEMISDVILESLDSHNVSKQEIKEKYAWTKDQHKYLTLMEL